MTEDTTASTRTGSSVPALGAIGAAVLAWAFAAHRLGDTLPMPRHGGLARVFSLALSRTPELFVLLGGLWAASVAAALVALGGSPKARRIAAWLGGALLCASAAAVLSVLPPPLDAEGWSENGERMAFAQPGAVYALAVLAMTVHVLLLGSAHAVAAWRAGGVRALWSEPALAAMLAWMAIAMPVPQMWWSRDESALGEPGVVSWPAVLGAAVALGIVQAALRAHFDRRRGNRP